MTCRGRGRRGARYRARAVRNSTGAAGSEITLQARGSLAHLLRSILRYTLNTL